MIAVHLARNTERTIDVDGSRRLTVIPMI